MLHFNDTDSFHAELFLEPSPNRLSMYYQPSSISPPLSPLFFFRPSNRINFNEEFENFEPFEDIRRRIRRRRREEYLI